MKKTFTENRTSIVAGLLLLTFVLLVASLYVALKQGEYRNELALRLAEHDAMMRSLSEMLARESADAITNQIIEDCPLENRERFDTLLGSLSQLNQTELAEVNSLFDDCGDFYAKRQAIVTMRLGRELEIYEDYIQLLKTTDTNTQQYSDRHKSWSALYELELSRSSLATELVEIQNDIIDLLREGETIQSERMRETLETAQSAKDSIVVLNLQGAEIRSALSSI